ncbi:MAG: prepilin-type N-terminal cleavage/methylation domain-containing protein [Phycisphaerae bacterium]|nr:prepilin-type N-terminal cleavage/methylation domain-containing protein [Phycisphaerae bacterium]
MPRRTPGKEAFTLIELLVVVAIIALLISILLPSLSKAREQARATLCASRIGQLAKAMLIYSDDYEETPPFVATGYGRITDDVTYDKLGPPGKNTTRYFARNEDWLVQGERYIDEGWATREEQWPDDITAREGTLFTYTRYENLYRCPDFERVALGTPGRNNSPKYQGVFNYTRSILGRKILSSIVQDAEAGGEELAPGQILKTSSVYAPGAMVMMLDEQWDFHCAANYNDGGSVNIDWMWMCAEPVNCLVGDMIGSYHGSEGKVFDWPELMKAKQGNLAYYDGHVALYRDAWPYRSCPGDNWMPLVGKIAADPPTALRIAGLLFEGIYAQRGIDFGVDAAIALLMEKLK